MLFKLQSLNGGNNLAADEGQSSWLIYEKVFCYIVCVRKHSNNNYSYIPGIYIVHTTIISEPERILGLIIRDLDNLSFTLCLCGRLCKYFRGSQHLEEIMLKENIQRSQLLTLIDKFSEILVTCTLPEHCRVL